MMQIRGHDPPRPASGRAWILTIAQLLSGRCCRAADGRGWRLTKMAKPLGGDHGGSDALIEKLRELARNLWWTWQPNVISLFRELDPGLWRKTDHNPVEFLKRISAEQLERRAAEMALDSRIDYAFRRLAEYLKDTDSWGSVYASSLRVAAGRVLLGRVRPAREPADLLRRPRRPGRRPPQERQRPGRPADRHRPALRPGLLPPDARRQRLAAGDITSTPTPTCCRSSGCSAATASRC